LLDFFGKKKEGGGIKNKIIKPIDFPFDMDLYPYCSQELKDKMEPYRRPHNENPQEVPPYQNLTARYELIAILSHKGRDAEGGHYVAWVRQEDENSWLQFDDENVIPRNREYIRKLNGTEGADWHMAYMCIYRTKKI